MSMKKKLAPLLAASLVVVNMVPVMASEVEEPTKDISQENPLGTTTVTASIEETASGNVTYVVSIPSTVGFGALTRPKDTSQPNYATRSASVKLTKVDGLQEDQRVAVLVKDNVNGTNGFRVYGGATNQSLDYRIMVNQTEINNTNGTAYTNGLLVGALQEEGNAVDLTFQLDQNQIYNGELSDWVGSYQGSLTFYSKVAGVNEFN